MPSMYTEDIFPTFPAAEAAGWRAQRITNYDVDVTEPGEETRRYSWRDAVAIMTIAEDQLTKASEDFRDLLLAALEAMSNGTGADLGDETRALDD